MSEGTKTISFICAAVLVVTIAVVTRPTAPAADPESPAGKMLAQVSDPLSATRLEITEYSQDTASLRNFEVAYIDGSWVIPSHQNYPADAEQQMGDAATSVMNRKILAVVSTNAGDHELYGVVEPQLNLTAGATGVGTKVTMRDGKNDALVNLIIGKPVKDQESQRYVRAVGKDPVYVVDLDPSYLSTDFGRWIEKDLLQLDPLAIMGLELKDYSVQLSIGPDGRPQILMDPRSEIEFDFDEAAEENPWQVVELQQFDSQAKQLQPVDVPSDEQVNQTKLNDLKTALDDLKIVDVERKPQGLSDDLKAEASFANDAEAVQSLATRGFYPVPVSQTDIEIYSSEGEVIAEMNDGVEYVLRFGKITIGDQGGRAGEDGESNGTGINRYLFVSARFNEEAVPKPNIEELPAETPAEQDAPVVGAPPEPDEESTEEGEASDVERTATEEQNAQQQADYEQQLEAGRERVQDLNRRFGDWYYVISDDVYKKIHLGRDDILQKIETPAGEGAGLGDLDALEAQGLE